MSPKPGPKRIAIESCPYCGFEHDERVMRACQTIEDVYGEFVHIALEDGRAWKVPRSYVALHGLKAVELPALAEKFGWEGAQ